MLFVIPLTTPKRIQIAAPKSPLPGPGPLIRQSLLLVASLNPPGAMGVFIPQAGLPSSPALFAARPERKEQRSLRFPLVPKSEGSVIGNRKGRLFSRPHAPCGGEPNEMADISWAGRTAVHSFTQRGFTRAHDSIMHRWACFPRGRQAVPGGVLQNASSMASCHPEYLKPSELLLLKRLLRRRRPAGETYGAGDGHRSSRKRWGSS